MSNEKILCARCSAGFQPKRKTAQYCSDRCRVYAHRERKTAEIKRLERNRRTRRRYELSKRWDHLQSAESAVGDDLQEAVMEAEACRGWNSLEEEQLLRKADRLRSKLGRVMRDQVELLSKAQDEGIDLTIRLPHQR